MPAATPLEADLADVCLCHWPVNRDALAARVPDWLTVETADDTAWVTAVAHTIERVRSFGVDLTDPAEVVTVRTPVRGPADQRGVYFLSVFADDRLVDTVGAKLFELPAKAGQVARFGADGDEQQRRTLAVDGRVALDVRYAATERDQRAPPPDSLPSFLVDRSRYFTSGALGVRLCGGVSHDGWSIATVDADVVADLSVLGLPRADGEPLVHHSGGRRLALAPPTPLGLS